jgi:hypothetical protein
MKTIIFAVVLLGAAFSTHAQDAEKQKGCVLVSMVYGNALFAKNRGLDPKQALAMAEFKEIELDRRKSIVNQVYFDPVFARVVDSSDLQSQVMQTCMYGPQKPFEPLK